jgi:cold shock protein
MGVGSMSESDAGSGTLKGVVKWFNDAKGFGFIEHTSGKDVFVHYSVIATEGFKTLKDGENVEYEMKEGPKGLQAVRVLRTKLPGEEESSEGQATPAPSELMSAGGSSEAKSTSN